MVHPERPDRSAFEAALGLTLTDEQRRVVFHAPPGPAMVVAGAGAGKTAVMAARMAALVVFDEVPAEAILGLTFTRKAAAELSLRVDRYMRSLSQADFVATAGAPTVATYHSFAERLVTEFGMRIGVDPDRRVATDVELLPLAYDVVARAERLGEDGHIVTAARAVQALRQLDAELAEHVVSVERLRAQEEARLAVLEAVAKPPAQVARLRETSRLRRDIAGLVAEYRKQKEQAGLVDFGDLMRLAAQLATDSEPTGSELRMRFQSVLLDEYQDTSVAQRIMLSGIFGGGHRVLAVGDPKQAIYGFRGAAAGTMTDFPRHFPPTHSPSTFTLSCNFRSERAIVALANDSEAAQGQVHGDMEARADAGPGSVEVALLETVDDERAFVVESVLAELDRATVPDEIMVLARSNAQVADFAAALAIADVPVTSSDAVDLFAAPGVAEMVATLTIILDPGANLELVTLLSGPRWCLGPRDLLALSRRAAELAPVPQRPGGDLQAALRKAVEGTDPLDVPCLLDAVLSPGDAALSDAAVSRLGHFVSEYEALARHAAEPAAAQLARIARTTGLDVELALGLGAQARRTAFDALMAVARSCDGLAPGEFLRRVRLARDAAVSPEVEPPAAPGCVRVMTVHKAKGLEADVVLLPGMYAGSFDDSSLRGHWVTTAGALPEDLRGDVPVSGVLTAERGVDVDELQKPARRRDAAEGDRVVYVGLTRARRRLVVTSHIWTRDRVRPRMPSKHLVRLVDVSGIAPSTWCDPESTPRPEHYAQGEGESSVGFPSGDPAMRMTRRHLADFVRAVEDDDAGDGALPDAEPRVAGWRADAAALVRERDEMATHAPVVRLPDGLSVAGVQRLMASPSGFATDLRRPMPRKPSSAAALGSRFHEWYATRWGQLPLIDDAEWAADAPDESPELDALIAAFEASPWAERHPEVVEHPVVVPLGGRTVFGRIDAVFRDGDRWQVIDWKTTRGTHADELQLAFYRVAWAAERGVPVESVDAAFHYVRANRTEWLRSAPDRAELERRWSEVLTGSA